MYSAAILLDPRGLCSMGILSTFRVCCRRIKMGIGLRLLSSYVQFLIHIQLLVVVFLNKKSYSRWAATPTKAVRSPPLGRTRPNKPRPSLLAYRHNSVIPFWRCIPTFRLWDAPSTRATSNLPVVPQDPRIRGWRRLMGIFPWLRELLSSIITS